MSTTNAVHIRVNVHHQQHTQHRDTQHQHLWRHSPQQQHPQLLYNTHSKDIWSNNRHNSTESWCPWQDKSSRTSHSNTTRSIPTVQIELAANVPILYVKFNFKGIFPYFRSETYLAGIPTATVLKLLLLWMLLSRRGLWLRVLLH